MINHRLVTLPNSQFAIRSTGHQFTVDGKAYKTVDQFFHASKYPDDQAYADKIRAHRHSGEIFRLGNRPPTHPDWENAKDDIMYKGIKERISQHEALQQSLLGTGNAKLEHFSAEPYWGNGRDGSGANKVGEILMRIRQELGGSGAPPADAKLDRPGNSTRHRSRASDHEKDEDTPKKGEKRFSQEAVRNLTNRAVAAALAKAGKRPEPKTNQKDTKTVSQEELAKIIKTAISDALRRANAEANASSSSTSSQTSGKRKANDDNEDNIATTENSERKEPQQKKQKTSDGADKAQAPRPQAKQASRNKNRKNNKNQSQRKEQNASKPQEAAPKPQAQQSPTPEQAEPSPTQASNKETEKKEPQQKKQKTSDGADKAQAPRPQAKQASRNKNQSQKKATKPKRAAPAVDDE